MLWGGAAIPLTLVYMILALSKLSRCPFRSAVPVLRVRPEPVRPPAVLSPLKCGKHHDLMWQNAAVIHGRLAEAAAHSCLLLFSSSCLPPHRSGGSRDSSALRTPWIQHVQCCSPTTGPGVSIGGSTVCRNTGELLCQRELHALH